MTVQIRHSKSLRNTEAFALIVEGWNEVLQDGLTPDNDALPPYGAESHAIYALSLEQEPLGVIVYAREPAGYRMQFAYVEPSSRQRGLFRKLRDELAALARKEGAPVVGLQAA